MGSAITIGCNYKKGEEIAQGWTGLCNLCWQWRKLPANYFPVLLNEVSCDMNDVGCLSGIIFLSTISIIYVKEKKLPEIK